MQTTGNLVGIGVEFTTGVQGSHSQLNSRNPFLRVDFNRNTTAVIRDCAGVVHVEGDLDPVAITGHRFIDRVVDDFVNQMVQTADIGGTDIHGRPFANRLKPLEYRN